MIGLKIPKVIFKTREGDTSTSPNECSIGGKWVDKSTDDYFKAKFALLLISWTCKYSITAASEHIHYLVPERPTITHP